MVIDMGVVMAEFEDHIRALTTPRHGTYPRPWMTDTDPGQANVLIVGASSAKTFHTADVGSHDKFLDALWNRNGQTCRAMYNAATVKPSRTRPNLDRLSEMLAARGLTSLQTNVTCASGRYDAEVPDEDRVHGTELFRAVVAHVPWSAMIIYGVGASKQFGRVFDVAMPPVPKVDSPPVWTMFQGRPVFVSPTLAFPGYLASVWSYVERVVVAITDGSELMGMPAPRPVLTATTPPTQRKLVGDDTVHRVVQDTPLAFNSTDANRRVWQRMHEIAAKSGLEVKLSNEQATLVRGPTFLPKDRVFRHKFNRARADILVRDDVFEVNPSLWEAAAWTTHTNPIFQNIKTDDLPLLSRILDAVETFAGSQAH